MPHRFRGMYLHCSASTSDRQTCSDCKCGVHRGCADRWFTLGTTARAQSSGSLSESSSSGSAEGIFPVSLAAATFSRSFVVSSASAVLSFASTPGPGPARAVCLQVLPPVLPHRLVDGSLELYAVFSPPAHVGWSPKSNASFLTLRFSRPPRPLGFCLVSNESSCHCQAAPSDGVPIEGPAGEPVQAPSDVAPEPSRPRAATVSGWMRL
jgi:hypothetical protein